MVQPYQGEILGKILYLYITFHWMEVWNIPNFTDLFPYLDFLFD